VKVAHFFIIAAIILQSIFTLQAQTAVGTEFWLTFGQNVLFSYNEVDLQIRITGGVQAASVTIRFTDLGAPDDVTFSVAPGSIYTHILNNTQKAAVYNTSQGINNRSVHITSSAEVAVSAINQHITSTDATNILPVNALGNEYYQISYTNLHEQYFPDTYAIVATQDNTQVFHNGVWAATLNKGQVYHRTSPSDMTGAHITSDKPVAFFAMCRFVYIPANILWGDYLFQQLAPVHTWGKNFFVPVSHLVKDRVRIVVSENNTNISLIDGELKNAAGSQMTLTNLQSGQFVELEVNLNNNGCYIQSDKPIGVCTYLTGGMYNGFEISDPAQAWLPAIEQTISSALIAPFIPIDTTNLNQHYALIVTPTATQNNTTVSVGGAPTALNGGTWRNHSSGYSFYSMPLTNDTASYLFSNPGKLFIMSYGIGEAESYYYLAASAMRDLVGIDDCSLTLHTTGVSSDGFITLEWQLLSQSPELYGYTLFQLDEITGIWQSISTQCDKTIKVLNVYPDIETSNTLKTWMEDPAIGLGKILVTPVKITDFNNNPNGYLKNASGEYQYDVVMFGSWDNNNGQDLTSVSASAVGEFLNSGRGVLFGHDTQHWDRNFASLSDRVNMHIAENNWQFFRGSSHVKAINEGFLLKYPHHVPYNSILEIPCTHTSGQFAKGIVWMNFPEPQQGDCFHAPVYELYGGTNDFYLTTWNNAAMIQTGHSTGESSIDERKVIANTLWYLSQFTTDTTAKVCSAFDLAAPDTPTAIRQTGNCHKIDITSKDNGTRYSFFVKAINMTDHTDTCTSNTLDVINKTGLKGYYVLENNIPTSNQDISFSSFVTATDNQSITYTVQNPSHYVHIQAVDFAGNLSAVVTLNPDDCSYIPCTDTYTVTLKPLPGFTILPVNGSTSPVICGGNYSFTVHLNNCCDFTNFTVYANDTVLKAVDKVFTIYNINTDQVVKLVKK